MPRSHENNAPAWLTGLMETGNCLCCCVKRKDCRKQVIKRRGSLKLKVWREREIDMLVAVTLTYRFCIWKDHPLALAILGRRCTAKPLAVQLTRPLLVLFRVRERYSVYIYALFFFSSFSSSLYSVLYASLCCLAACNDVREHCSRNVQKEAMVTLGTVVVKGRRTCEESVGWAESMTALSLHSVLLPS